MAYNEAAAGAGKICQAAPPWAQTGSFDFPPALITVQEETPTKMVRHIYRKRLRFTTFSYLRRYMISKWRAYP
jgi:hypothetical protein